LNYSTKNSRRVKAEKVSYAEEKLPSEDEPVQDDESDVELLSSSEDNIDELLCDSDVEKANDGKRNALVKPRVSARANKAKGSMQELSDDDDDKDNSIPDTLSAMKKPPSRTPDKSPARRHKQRRMTIQSMGQISEYTGRESKSMGGWEGEKENFRQAKLFEPFKVQKILATRTEPRNAWTTITKKMNTSELDYGSRWVQDPVDESDSKDEVRFLVKWNDLSYMHCSWETRKDLLEFIEGAEKTLSVFQKKSQDGLIFSSDERCDGDYFDPAWAQIDRILEIHYPEQCPCQSVENEDTVTNEELGIVVNMSDPEYENGLGRQFLVKWGNRPYSDMSYEFERDLILNDIEYKPHLKAFFDRNSKVSYFTRKGRSLLCKSQHVLEFVPFLADNKLGSQETP
jgi:hypothetical protein